jgi:hypothetical protein
MKSGVFDKSRRTLHIVNLPGAAAHGGMIAHLLVRTCRPRVPVGAISGIALRRGPVFVDVA